MTCCCQPPQVTSCKLIDLSSLILILVTVLNFFRTVPNALSSVASNTVMVKSSTYTKFSWIPVQKGCPPINNQHGEKRGPSCQICCAILFTLSNKQVLGVHCSNSISETGSRSQPLSRCIPRNQCRLPKAFKQLRLIRNPLEPVLFPTIS